MRRMDHKFLFASTAPDTKEKKWLLVKMNIAPTTTELFERVISMKQFYEMDEFELAGFDEETCERLRKISAESGIDPYTLINFVNHNRTDIQPLSEMEQFTSAWYRFKKRPVGWIHKIQNRKVHDPACW